MSLTKKIVGNTLVQMIGRISTALLALISIKLITNKIGVEGYGMYTTVYEFLALFAIAGDFGIYTIALREMASKSESEKGNENSKGVSFIYQNILGLRIILMIIFMAIGILSSFLIPKYHGTLISYGIIITSLTVFANLVNSIANSILQLHLKMTYATYSLILGKIVSVAIIAYGAFFINSHDASFYVFLIAGVFGNFSMLGLSLFYAKKFSDISPKFDFEYWKEIFKKSAPYGIALILGTIYFKIDVILISILRDNKEVGIYAVGLRIIEVFVVLPTFFMNSILPSLTIAIEKNQEKIRSILQFSFDFLAITGIPIVFLFSLLSKFIVKIASSESFISGGTLKYGGDVALILLIIAMSFSFFSNFISISLVAFRKQKHVLFINSFGVIVNIILNLIYIPKYGFIAAGIISIISEIIIFTFGFLLFQKTFSFIPDLKPILKILFSSIIMFGVGYYLKTILGNGNMQSIIIGGICTLIYLTLVLAFKLVDIKKLFSPTTPDSRPQQAS